MKISPISEAAATAPGLFKRGPGDFEVMTAEEKVSKSGNPMIELLNKVYDAEGKSRLIKDWLVESEGMAYKTRHYAVSTGQLAQYEKGELRAADQPGKTGRCQIGIEKQEGYPDRNNIKDYLVPSGKLIASIPDAELDDDIPF